MIKALPIAWFVLAGLTIIAALVLAARAGPHGFALMLPGTLTSASFALGTGLVYSFVLLARPSAAIAILGYIHLLFEAVSTGFGFGGQSLTLYPDRMSEPGTMTAMQWLYGVNYVTGLLAGVFFIITMLVARNTKSAASETF